jgi:hypothetical protein
MQDLPTFLPSRDTSTAQIQYGELAQLGERLVCNQEVTGSSPVFSTSFICPSRCDERSLTTEYSANGSFSDHTHAVCMKAVAD